MLHWILNPGLAINELIFGQRVPKVALIEKGSSKSLQERTIVPCPHCGTLHAGVKWSTKYNAFKNWFGLYCDHCGKIIPCLTNLTSLLLLGISFPIWVWFKAHWKKVWLNHQPARYRNLDLNSVPSPFEGYGWIKQGLFWGLFMYVFMTFLFPLLFKDTITLSKALFGIPFWILGGLLYGYVVKCTTIKQKSKAQMH